MIENIVKKKPGTFAYGTVVAVDEARSSVQVRLGTLTVWLQTSLSLNIGDTVIVARNDQDRSRLVVQSSQRSLPSEGTLLLI